MQLHKFIIFCFGLMLTTCVYGEVLIPKNQTEEQAGNLSQMKTSIVPTSEKNPENQVIRQLKEFKQLNGATVSFSYVVEITSSKALSSEDLALTLFLVEPNGDIKESSTPHFSLDEGLNTGGFNDAFIITNPIKGNYIIGYLARFRNETDANVVLTGKGKAALKSEAITETFISEQFIRQNLSGTDIVTLTANIVLIDGIAPRKMGGVVPRPQN